MVSVEQLNNIIVLVVMGGFGSYRWVPPEKVNEALTQMKGNLDDLMALMQRAEKVSEEPTVGVHFMSLKRQLSVLWADYAPAYILSIRFAFSPGGAIGLAVICILSIKLLLAGGRYRKSMQQVRTLLLGNILVCAVLRLAVACAFQQVVEVKREDLSIPRQWDVQGRDASTHPCTCCLTAIVIVLHIIQWCFSDLYGRVEGRIFNLVTQFEDGPPFTLSDVLWSQVSHFLHINSAHLFVNLSWVTLLSQLEFQHGSAYFGCLLVDMVVLTHTFEILLVWFYMRRPYRSLGLSGLLCAVKGFLWFQLSSTQDGLLDIGMDFSLQFGGLAFESMLFPDVSFLGHFAGVCAGVAYAKATHIITCL